VCLLVSDSPACLSQQMRIGNYQSLVVLPDEFRYFRNPLEYYAELGRQILMFSYTDDCFPKHLIEIAIRVSSFFCCSVDISLLILPKS
jgi:hypothetical protein